MSFQEPPSSGARIADELVLLATETAQRLEAVWSEVGYSAQEKQRQLESLCAAFRTECQSKVGEEEGVRDHFLQTIEESRAEARAILAVLGDTDTPVSSADVAFVAPNLTETLAHLECLLEGLRTRRAERRERFERIQQAIFLLCEELGEAPEPDFIELDNDLSVSRLRRFEAKRDEMNHATEHRAQTVAELALACQAVMAELGMESTSELDLQIAGSVLPMARPDGGGDGDKGAGTTVGNGGSNASLSVARLVSMKRSSTCLGASRAALDEVAARHVELTSERDRRKANLERMGEDILALWQRLGVPQEEQDRFSASVNGIGAATMEAGERELARLRTLKAGMLGELLERATARVTELWDLTNAPHEERAALNLEVADTAGDSEAIAPAKAEDADALLSRLETEAARLSALHETMRPLLERAAEREALAAERWRHETEERDSSRLKDRGAEKTKALQRELELEKRIKKRLPFLNDRLRKGVAAWEEKAGRPFFYGGSDEPYLGTLERTEEEYARLLAEMRAAKDAKKREERQKLMHNAAPAAAGQQANVVALPRGGGGGGAATRRPVPQSARKPAGPAGGGLHTPAANRTGAMQRAPHTAGPSLAGGQGRNVDEDADIASNVSGSENRSSAGGGSAGASAGAVVGSWDNNDSSDSLHDVSNRLAPPAGSGGGMKRSSSGSTKSKLSSENSPLQQQQLTPRASLDMAPSSSATDVAKA